MKKVIIGLMLSFMLFVTACNKGGSINVVSREDGSGTRGAFIELFGVEQKTGDKKVDKTIDTAEITNSTSVMLTTIEGDENAIGYASLGSVGDNVKKLKIDGVAATVEDIKNGNYKIARPFLVTSPKEIKSEVAKEFLTFIYSKEGKKIIEDAGYIAEKDDAFTSKQPKGNITIAGSSSVSPLMEKLAEQYQKLNPNAKIQVQQNDSTTGITSTINKSSDLGMASRALSDEEKKSDIVAHVIATDGIAVIVNKNSKIDDLKKDDVKKIYTGEITSWDDLNAKK